MVAPLLSVFLCSGCGGAHTIEDEREIAEITQKYLTEQVNSVTQNPESNRFLGTNRLAADRITQPLAGMLEIELIRVAREKLLHTIPLVSLFSAVTIVLEGAD